MTERNPWPALAVLGLALLAAAPALAEEGRPLRPIPLLLSLSNVPVESPQAAFEESLRSGLTPRQSPEWVILPDGSARYGTATVGVIVKNPCPEGKHPALAVPARSRR